MGYEQSGVQKNLLIFISDIYARNTNKIKKAKKPLNKPTSRSL